MKIKLIAPAPKPEWGESFWDLKTLLRLTNRDAAGVSLALPTLAALTPSDVDITITDERIESINFEEDVDLVGISFITYLAPRAYEIADAFRARGVKVVFGGIHASMLPQEAAVHSDSVVIGEAEEIWPRLINDFKRGALRKVYKMQRFPDISSAPIPRWDLIKAEKYACFTVQTGRGCPYDCDFCSVRLFNGTKYRHKSIENVVKELKALRNIDSRKTILFADDNFLAVPSYAGSLLKEISKLGLKAWWCQTSVNRLKNDYLLDLLHKAGCEAVFVGFESVSQDSLKSFKKEKINKVEEYQNIVEKVHDQGLAVIGSFMLGSDFEKLNAIESTGHFISRSKIPFAMINYLTPTPGSKFFDSLKENKRITENDWAKYNGEHICFKPKNISKQVLRSSRTKLLQDIYSYDESYKRLLNLWKKSVFTKQRLEKRRLLTKGRLLFTLSALFSNKAERNFILKSLWGKNVSSLGSISLAINFHKYARNSAKTKSLNE